MINDLFSNLSSDECGIIFYKGLKNFDGFSNYYGEYSAAVMLELILVRFLMGLLNAVCALCYYW